MRYLVLLSLLLFAGPVVADDSEMFRKNVSSNPGNESEHAALRMLPVYVPPQSSDGPVTHIEDPLYGGFPGHGKRDAFGAVSLDDGATWNRTNLSKSADLSSFTIKDGRKKVPYPGDVGRSLAASDGNKVLVVWVRRVTTP